jgi:MATE family multidrug resistance protein
MASGPRSALNFQQQQLITSPEQEREDAIAEEASLLRDNNILPPKHARRRESQASSRSGSGLVRKISLPGFSIPRRKSHDEESGPKPTEPSETTALLPDSNDESPTDDPTAIDKTFEDAVISGNIKTTWQRETKTLAAYSGPLMLTFILQTSLTLTSVFTVGHIGKNELGAVSLGSMTANITGYAVYHGLATSLDTLCAQAYGSGRKKLVGLNLQRAVFFLWAVTIPIAVLWFFGDRILMKIVPEKEIAELAGLYLKILILGAPGYACFESSKRFVQAQGKFAANMYVLFIAAPLNVLMHWLFVWVRFVHTHPVVPLSLTIDSNNTAIRMGFHRLPHRHRNHRNPHADPPPNIRRQYRRQRMLARLHLGRIPQLGPNAATRPTWPRNDNGRVPRLRDPHSRQRQLQRDTLGCEYRSAESISNDVSAALPS